MLAWGYYAPPDDPARRVVWVLPLAVALVLCALLGVGRLLRLSSPRPPRSEPVEVRIYELPAQRASRAAPASRPPTPAPSHAAAAPKARAPQPSTATITESRARRAPHVRRPAAPAHEPHGRRVARAARRERAAQPAPPPPSRPLEAPPPPRLDLSQLGKQIDAAVASTLSDSEFAQIHDPHTLVARYYLAAVLRKLHRVGEMIYLGNRVGQCAVMLVIGAGGEVDDLRLYSSSGDPKLDDYAFRIVRLSTPFPAFPVALERQTQQLKLVVQMDFEGYRDVEAY